MSADRNLFRLRATQVVKSFLYRYAGIASAWVPGMDANTMLVASMRHAGIDLVFDVGANIGQFARDIRAGGYTGNIVSFEPLAQPHTQLRKSAAGQAHWQVHPRCALGGKCGEAQINVSGNSVSSSLLPMLDAHRKAAPSSQYYATENVPLNTLDSLAAAYLEKASFPFLKIDVQGNEWEVLEGAKSLLPGVKGILIELSYIPLYEGQRMAKDIIRRLEAEGFTLWRLDPVFNDRKTGRLLQANGLFYR